MGPFRFFIVLVAGFLFTGVALGQQVSPQGAAPQSPQPTGLPTAQQVAQGSSLLQQSLATQTGGSSITDITLTGSISFIEGTQTESAAMTLTALAGGASQVTIAIPSGTETEVWSISSDSSPTVSGTGPNGSVTQPAGGSVTMPSPAWFSPALLTTLFSSSGYTSSYVGSETRYGVSVQHLAIWQIPTQGSTVPAFIAQRQAQNDVYLDPTTMLPVSIVSQVRPYHKPGSEPLSIRARPSPEEVRYSNYSRVQGRNFPLQIQVYLGDTPQTQIMEITISSVAINTGATIAAASAVGN